MKKDNIYLKKMINFISFLDNVVKKDNDQDINSNKTVTTFSDIDEYFNDKYITLTTDYSISAYYGYNSHALITINEYYCLSTPNRIDIEIKFDPNGRRFDVDRLFLEYDVTEGYVEYIDKTGIFKNYSPTESFNYMKHVITFLNK